MHPSLSDLRALEVSTLRRVSEIGEFARLGDLRTAAKIASAQVNEHKGPINVHLGFRLDIRLRAKRKRSEFSRWVGVGAVVEPSNDNETIRHASYSLIICRAAIDSAIVRKFHIDYEPIAFRNQGDPKPSIHMQWCGALSSRQIADGYSEKKLQALYPDFEKPRIPSAPTSLALMLNWLLLEFQDDAAAQPILRNPTWRNLVADAERTVLRPYYEHAALFFSKTANAGKRFCQTHLYQLTHD